MSHEYPGNHGFRMGLIALSYITKNNKLTSPLFFLLLKCYLLVARARTSCSRSALGGGGMCKLCMLLLQQIKQAQKIKVCFSGIMAVSTDNKRVWTTQHPPSTPFWIQRHGMHELYAEKWD